MQLKNDSLLQNGKYRIIRVLGQGGFGITYLAEHTILDKMVAIKEFFPKDFCGRNNTSQLTLGTQNNAETITKLKERFLKEAKNIAILDHPGIVKIHDIFEENNTAYYVMDYIDGENLNEMVKRNGPLSETKAIEYIRKVGDALDYIHSRKMTHFDVKPANILIRHSDDLPLLVDFGLSKQYDIHGDATSTLIQGVSHGYSPIELYNAGSITTFSPQTDIYSLSATLYYLLTATDPPSASQITEFGLTLPANIPNDIANSIRNAMQTCRNKRPESIHSFFSQFSNATHYSERMESKRTQVPEPIASEDTISIIHTQTVTHNEGQIKETTSQPSETTSIRISAMIIIALLIIAICAYMYFLQDTHAHDTSKAIDTSFTDITKAQVGDYLYENNRLSHTKIQGEQTLGRVLYSGYHPTIFSLVPVSFCTKDEIPSALISFSNSHNNVRVPSIDDWEHLAKNVYHYSVKKECRNCNELKFGTGDHNCYTLEFYIQTNEGKRFHRYMQLDGMQAEKSWCNENGNVFSIDSDGAYRLWITPDFGNCGDNDSHNPEDRANLLVLYNL